MQFFANNSVRALSSLIAGEESSSSMLLHADNDSDVVNNNIKTILVFVNVIAMLFYVT
jgi:hypothetical protein